MNLSDKKIKLIDQALGYALMHSQSESESAEFALLRSEFASKVARINQSAILINEAKEKYPIGSKFISPRSFREYTRTGIFHIDLDGNVLVETKESRFHVFVKKNGVWADNVR